MRILQELNSHNKGITLLISDKIKNEPFRVYFFNEINYNVIYKLMKSIKR